MGEKTPNMDKVNELKSQITRMVENHPKKLKEILEDTTKFANFPEERENFKEEMQKKIKELTDNIDATLIILKDV